MYTFWYRKYFHRCGKIQGLGLIGNQLKEIHSLFFVDDSGFEMYSEHIVTVPMEESFMNYLHHFKSLKMCFKQKLLCSLLALLVLFFTGMPNSFAQPITPSDQEELHRRTRQEAEGKCQGNGVVDNIVTRQ
jgi:hypothetical protein